MSNKIWDIEKDLRKSLSSDTKNLLNKLNKHGSELALCHLTGLKSRREYVKESSVRLSCIKFSRKSNLKINQITSSKTNHDEAFLKHIHLFGRTGTLFEWIQLFSKLNVPESSFDVVLTIKKCKNDFIVNWDDKTLKVDVSSNLAKDLLPHDIDGYVKWLYEGDDTNISKFDLDYRRSILLSTRVNLKNTDIPELLYKPYSIHNNDIVAKLDNEQKKWLFVGALQTSLLYTYLSQENQIDNMHCGFIVHVDPTVKIGYEAELFRYAMLINTCSVKDDNIDEYLKILKVVEGNSVNSETSQILKDLCNRLPNLDPNNQIFTEYINNITNVDYNINGTINLHWKKILIKWLSAVLVKLRNKVHEGLRLDFYIIVADLQDLKDLENITVRKIRKAKGMPTPFKKWDTLKEDDFKIILRDTCKILAKNNYAWFHDGANALLWGSTFPENEPKYLVSIKNTNWKYVVDRCKAGEHTLLSSAVCSILYSERDGGAGIILEGKLQWILEKGEGKKYTFIGDDDKYLTKEVNNIYTNISQKINLWTNLFVDKIDNVKLISKKLIKAIISIAEDPNRGAMLIFMDNNCKGEIPFISMGNYWNKHTIDIHEIDLTSLISLMSMDGATILYSYGNDISMLFRGLAVADKSEIDLQDECKNNLDGAGSRRWSAAYAATREDVHQVMVISQDGPIDLFHKENTKNGKKVKYESMGYSE